VITHEGSLIINSSRKLLECSAAKPVEVSIDYEDMIGGCKIGAHNQPKMVYPDSVDPSMLPLDHPFDDHVWKRVKYIKIVPRKFKENLELRFKDIVKTGNTL
jgi:hypothetical protein